MLRFAQGGFEESSSEEPKGEVLSLFQSMKLTDRDWEGANVLALVGMLAVVLGWLSIQMRPRPPKRLKFDLSESVMHVSVAGMLVGGFSIFAFVMMNASLGVI